jgi:hypothetical protein
VTALRGAPITTLVWTGEVPNVPIAPLARRDFGLTPDQVHDVAERVAAAGRMPRVAPPAPTPRSDTRPEAAQEHHHEPPAPTPDEEESMPTGIRAEPCKGCGTKGSKHRQVDGKDCPERGKSAPPARAAAAPKVVALRRPAPPGKPGDVDALLARREALVTELGQVNEHLRSALSREEQRLEKLRAAVGPDFRATVAE